MKVKNALLALTVLLLVFFMAACGSSNTGSSPSPSPSPSQSPSDSGSFPSPSTAASTRTEIIDIKIGGGSQGGTWFVYGGKIADILNNHVPGIRASGTLGGGTTNVVSVHTGEYLLALNHAWTARLGYEGKGPFEEKYDKVRYVMSFFPAVNMFIAKKGMDIEYVDQLDDQKYRIALQPKTGLGPYWAETTFEALGFSADGLAAKGSQVTYSSHSVSAQAMQDGLVDIIQLLDPYRSSVALELDQNPGIKLLKLSGETLQKITSENPGLIRVDIPGGVYSGSPDVVPALGSMNALTASADLPDDVVYDITKALVEHLDELNEVFPPEYQLQVGPNLVEGISVPMHPGAKRYFEEIGIQVVEPQS